MPRLFAGWDFTDDDTRDLVGAGYARGVPMGSELAARPGEAKAPTLLLGDQISVALFAVDGRTLGALEHEAGYVNFEQIALG